MAKPYVCGGYTANELYDLFNSRYFRNKLPKIPVKWSDPSGRRYTGESRGIMGATWFNGDGRPRMISLNPKYKSSGTVWVTTLLHEMVHVEQYNLPAKQAHGRKFQKRMKRLANAGAFNHLW